MSEEKTWFNCKWLYIKDFITGICDKPKSRRVVKPNDTCELWEEREDKNVDRFETWDKNEEICMNCAISQPCKFSKHIIKMCKLKCEFEEIDEDERYNVGIGFKFICKHFIKQED